MYILLLKEAWLLKHLVFHQDIERHCHQMFIEKRNILYRILDFHKLVYIVYINSIIITIYLIQFSIYL